MSSMNSSMSSSTGGRLLEGEGVSDEGNDSNKEAQENSHKQLRPNSGKDFTALKINADEANPNTRDDAKKYSKPLVDKAENRVESLFNTIMNAVKPGDLLNNSGNRLISYSFISLFIMVLFI